MKVDLEGKCIIVSAPSGAGKTTIVRSLLQDFPMLSFSVSACSREPRSNEIEGKDYYFVGVERFKKFIIEEAFVEWEEVYKDTFYGTLKEELFRIWAQNKVAVFDVDVEGGIKLKEIFSASALSIFIQPPNMRTLEERLISRNTESAEKISIRINKAKIELTKASAFDVVVVNENLATALNEVKNHVLNFTAK